MSISNVLFDLDGTLLPMDLDIFIKAYFGAIAKYMAPHGYEPGKLIEAIWQGTGAMVKNRGQQTNEQAFWQAVTRIYGDKITADQSFFDSFYITEFDKLRDVCGYDPMVSKIVHLLKRKGYRVILATNPIFPAMATQWRIRWAGLQPEDFALYTTYENSCYSKPNLDYYRSILQKFQIPADECLMVGNDVVEDMVAEELGMDVFLLTNCLINKHNRDIGHYRHGDFDTLFRLVEGLPDLI